ncbi:ankyrin repeat domain-containing protein [Helicobacter sp. 23-1048]
MKKLGLIFLIAGLLAQVAFAFPPDFCNGCEPHLSNKGVMSKNTLKHKPCMDNESIRVNLGCFSGEVELTGVVVSAYNNEEEENIFETRFYPDRNLDLPFLYYSYCDASGINGGVFDDRAQKWDCSKITFKRLNFGVNLKIDSKKVFLPKAIVDKHLGENGIRAKVRLKDYNFYGEFDENSKVGHEAYATLIEFSPLGKVYEHYEDGGEFISLKYGSKDSVVNLRDKPNGNIIAQIKREDMRCGAENDEIFWVDYPPDTKIEKLPQNKWLEVFYYPLNAKKPQEAIYGYIHSSQLKLSCDSQSAQDLSKNQLLCEAIWQSDMEATKSDIEAIKQALQSGANVNTADCNGSPFAKSVYSGRFDIALYLVKNKNFNVNMRDIDNGDTPLIIAVNMNCEIKSSECKGNDKIYEIAKLLMQKGANPYMKNKERISAISLAESEGCGCEYKPDNKMLKILQWRSSKK